MSLDRRTANLTVGGGPIALVATVSPADATDTSVTWSSSDTSIATVGATGIVQPVAPGFVRVTVTTVDGGLSTACDVIVAAASGVRVSSVSLDEDTLELAVGAAPRTLNAAVDPENATNPAVTWESSDPDVATVGASGVVTAIAEGTTTITVTSVDGGHRDTSIVTVRAPAPPWDGFSPTGPGYTVSFQPANERGAWEGWGASLAWWAAGVGESDYEALYADLFFTREDVLVREQTLPGLGLNIVRYNVGGGGMQGDIPGLTENVPSDLPWFKDIDGFLLDWNAQGDPASASWDFARDARQRAVLTAAIARGVTHVELFANAPMWWMTHEKSSAGGSLQSWNRGDFARYLATVAARARTHWGVSVSMSVEPFNEPMAGWWTYPKGQEGCNIDVGAQAEILGALREQLDARALADVTISASDENDMNTAANTLADLTGRQVTVHGTPVSAASLVDNLNVHGYSGLEPFRDNAARTRLRSMKGGRRLSMSEYGDGEGSGMTLAQSITEDLTYLRPSAWIYWQPLEPYSAWGLLNGAYAPEDGPNQADRGRPTWVYTKYYVFAQFTRFIRPSAMLLESNDANSIVALDVGGQRLSVVTVNYGNAQIIRYDLSAFAAHGSVARVTYTDTSGAHVFTRFDARVVDHVIELPAFANSVYSFTVDAVVR